MRLTCREFEGFIMDYFDGTLGREEHAAFTEHLEDCDECREYLDRYLLAIELGKKVFAHPDEALPPDVPEDLIEGILEVLGRHSR
ncbi:MAG: anti-sigma factor family protein [Sandaracinaceae bacterium]